MKKRVTRFFLLVALSVGAATYAADEPLAAPPPPPTQAALGPASQVLKFLEGKKDELPADDFILLGDTKVDLIPVTSDHDAYIFFGRVGCKAAVPLMIRALSEFERAAKAGKEMTYTSAHLHHALIAQTGEDFGYDRAAWQKWWDQVGKNLPDDHFDPESNSKKRANQRLEPTPTAVTPAASAAAAPASGVAHH
jgi:hypothetical protein